MNTLTYGSLFSGIGGIDLGLDRAGMQCKWQVEIDEYATKVLAKHWPDVARFRDIRDCGANNLTSVDLICGGFPCQDISVAGKRAGIDGERSGLWREFYRIICELRPSFVFVENVPALLYGGIDRVLGNLSESGYDAEWQIVSAEALGAPHLRERVFIVGYPMRVGCRGKRIQYDTGAFSGERSQDVCTFADSECSTARMEEYRGSGQEWQSPNASQSTLLRQENRPTSSEGVGAGSEDVADPAITGLPFRGYTGLSAYATQAKAGLVFQSQRCRAIEQSIWWATEPDVGRVANGVPHRVDRIRGLGNAVVPQIAEYIGNCIMNYHQQNISLVESVG